MSMLSNGLAWKIDRRSVQKIVTTSDLHYQAHDYMMWDHTGALGGLGVV